MSTPYTRAPHQGGPGALPAPAPNAALLIDFDNVTMGMRSDLSKDLKKLLQSDVIRGKVTVQRAYADWRRYPQYIVPLSENSIDLIFAPAYGSSKKNATDIRMAIDGMELVFTRPEIGTFILLTGDSDFSSLVLKLKEYGKYVIGVGIQESSSDILVQNCDEYYSYNNLAGLQKTSETGQKPSDPWVLVEKSVKTMADRNDVMRSDRLKQVMIELDPAFDEGNFGYSKFSRFLTEAASKGLVSIKKMDNGQYEVEPGSAVAQPSGNGRGRRSEEGRERGRRGRGRGRDRSREETEVAAEAPSAPGAEQPGEKAVEPAPSAGTAEAAPPEGGTNLQQAYSLLRRAVSALLEERGEEAVRDSDVKRRMLDFDRSFDEAELGHSKFSRFLRQADDDSVIELRKRDSGNYEVALGTAEAAPAAAGEPGEPAERAAARPRREEKEDEQETEEKEDWRDEIPEDLLLLGAVEPPSETAPKAEKKPSPEQPREEPAAQKKAEPEAGERSAPTTTGLGGRRLGPRRGSTRRRGGDEPPPLFEGQVVKTGDAATAKSAEPEKQPEKQPEAKRGKEPDVSAEGGLELAVLGLPTDADAAKRYLANSYKGVGVKTAEALVDSFGDDVFQVLHAEPERVQDVLPSNRAETVLESWREDYRRRRESAEGQTRASGQQAETEQGQAAGRSGRRRTRRGGGRRKS